MEAEPNELPSVCRLSQVVLSEMTARVRMNCAGPVRIVDERDSSETDARSDQLRMLDQAEVGESFDDSASIDVAASNSVIA